MRHLHYSSVLAALVLASPVAAQDAGGDAEAGQAEFTRQCVACHVVQDGAGEVLAGRSSRTGPNLYGVVGREPGALEGFRYSPSLIQYGETGVVWGEENLVAFLQDPTGHLRDALDDPRARSTMSHRLRNAESARDVHAFLAQFSDGDDADADAALDADAEPVPDPADQADQADQAEAMDSDVHDLAAGEGLYRGSCRNCHGTSAQGMASFPALAGLEQAYLEERLMQYRAGERVGPNSGLMIPAARNLSDADIANVAAFIATTFD